MLSIVDIVFWVAAAIGIEWPPLMVAAEAALLGVLLCPAVVQRRLMPKSGTREI